MNGMPWTCCCRDRPQRFGWWWLELELSLMILAGKFQKIDFRELNQKQFDRIKKSD